MVGPRLAAFAVVFVMLLAGCTSSGNGGDADPASSTSGSVGPAPVVARINVTKDGGPPVDLAAGDALAFDASGSTGPIATYAWDFGDNATSANKRAEHSYAAAGTYNVTLTVTSLQDATSTDRVEVQVLFEPGQPLFRQSEALAGDLPLMNPNSCTNQDVDCRDHVIVVAAADANGTAAQASRVVVNLTGSSDLPGAALQVFWKAPDGTTLAQTEADGLEHTLEYAGSMGPGEYVVRVRLFTGAQASYTGTVEIDYVTV